MREIKLVIFDLDGTLVDAYPAITSSFNYTMRKLNYPSRDKLTICRAVGGGDENLLKPFINIKDLGRALSIYRKHHKNALIRQSSLFPKAEETLAYLKSKGYKLAVASNRPTRFSRVLIRHLKIERYFDYVLCADKLKNGKPHPQILNKIMQKFSLKPKDTLYVGDMVIDAQAARRAKVKGIVVTTGSSTRQEIKKEKPYRIIKKIAGLKEIL